MGYKDDFLYHHRHRALGHVQLRSFMTPKQREDFRAVLKGKARVVYNDDANYDTKRRPPLPGEIK